MTKPRKHIDPINVTVGRRLHMKRKILGLNQQDLGHQIGVSRLVISQFETGRRAIPASTLYKLAAFFNLPVSYFFDGKLGADDAQSDLKNIDPLLTKEAISLLKDFDALQKPQVQKAFSAVMERVAELNGLRNNK